MTTVLLLLLAIQQPAATTPATTAPAPKPPAAPTAAAPARRPGSATVTVDVRVTNRSGVPATGAHVTAVGPSLRDGTTDSNGVVTFRTVAPGTYRVRADADGLISLEKEFVVKAGAPSTTELALSPAPPPSAPPPPPPREAPPPPPPPAPVGVQGDPRMVSIPDLAEDSLSGREPVKVVPIGCTGLSNSRLIVVRESVPIAAYDDADETLYLVAGEATLTLGGKQQALTPGWFSLVPRGTKFGVARKGRNPAILLSIIYGRPCTTSSASRQ